MSDILEGLTFPVNGTRVYQEDWAFEQDSKSLEIVNSRLDSFSSGVVSGGVVVVGSGSAKVDLAQITIAYNEFGQRIFVPVTLGVNVLDNATSKIAVRFKLSVSTEVKPSGASLQYRHNDFEIVVRSGALVAGDVGLCEVSCISGVVTLGADLRIFREVLDGRLDSAVVSISDHDSRLDSAETSIVSTFANVDKIWSTGVVSGCDLTDNGDGTVSISTGVAMVRTSASASSPLVEIALPALSNQSFTDNTTNYIYYDKNSVWFVTQNISDFNGLDKVFAYKVSRAGVEVYFEDYRELNVDSNRKLRRVFRECNLTFKSTSGSLVSEIGTRNLAVSAGKFFRNLNYVSHSAFDSSIAGTSIDKVFRTYFKAGVNWVYFDNIKTLDNLQYNNTATGLVTLSNNYYVVHWIYLLLSGAKDSLSTTSRLVTVYSQAQYQTLADAQNSGLPASLPDVVSGAGVLLGRAIIQKSAVNTVSVQSAFSNTFSGSSIPPHESLVGLQGGQLGEYYHLTNGQYGNLGKVYNASSGQNLVLRSLILEIGSGGAPLLSLPNFIALVGQSGAIQQTGIKWNFMIVNDGSQVMLILSSGAAGTSDGSATIYYLASA